MTDKDIIKALEICSGAENICKNCYLLNYSMDYNACMAKLMTDAKDLITRQQAEIENLTVENQSLRTAANSLKMHYEEAQSEIDSLKIFRGYAKKRASDYRTMRDKYLNAKSEAVKEFADRLKDIFEHAYQFEYGYLLSKDVINTKLEKCLKETVGENND